MYQSSAISSLPKDLSEVDADFMTRLLRERGVIANTNSIESVKESGVGMTAGYFSSIKRIQCEYTEPTEAPKSFVVKAWPHLEIIPRENIQAMFKRDISAYLLDSDQFFPRPKVYLADYDVETNRWALVMEDAELRGEHKVHERELTFDEVMRLVPKMADIAAAWEGCHEGEKATRLDDLGVPLWASEENLAILKAIMPGGAELIDKLTSMADSSLVDGPAWDVVLGPGIAQEFTRKIEAFFAPAKPDSGGTCTLCHGDLRGDNLFLDANDGGWLAIDFQLLFRGPVPSDLAYLMTSASVLPEVYEATSREAILRAFYTRFMEKTRLYRDYTWEQFEAEFAMMSTVLFVYFIGFGASIWQAGALANEQAVRVELGGKGATIDDLSPEEMRQRMWWRKSFSNFRACFESYRLRERLAALPVNDGPMGEWLKLPAHLG